MRPRLTMAIAIAIPLALGAAGTALAMSSDTYGTRPIKELLPPKPTPSAESPQLPDSLEKVISDAEGGSGSSEGGDPSSTGGDGRTSDTTSQGTDASLASGLTWSWTVPYGGWRRFLEAGQAPYANSSVTYASVPAQSLPSVGTTTLARVSASAPRTPAYLWVLLSLGLLLIWAAGLAVFEPLGEGNRVLGAAGSVRRTARELPAGMTRSAGRMVVRVVRGFGQWGRR